MEESVKIPKPVCTNCDKEMPRKGRFCPHCGQKVFDGRIRMKELFTRFFHNITHLDGQFVRMVWQLLIPGKVTEEYFKGRIKRYPHPVQFFFVVMFFFLLMLHTIVEQRGGAFKVNINNPEKGGNTTIQDGEILNKYVIGLDLITQYKAIPDSMKSPGAQKVVYYLANNRSKGLDTLIGYSFGDSTQIDSITLEINKSHYKLSLIDIVQMPFDDIIARYQVTSWLDKIFVKQFVKTIRDTKSLANAIISSLTWTILVMSGFMAWILYLFFRRRRKYYVEHFIFMLHYFSGVFLVLTLLLAVQIFVVKLKAIFWVMAMLVLGTGLFMAIRRFYQTSGWRTFFVWSLFSITGLVGGIVIFVLGIMVVFLMY